MSPIDPPPHLPHQYVAYHPSYSQSSLNSSPASYFSPSIPLSPAGQYRPHHTKSHSYPVYAPIPLPDPITLTTGQLPGYIYPSGYPCTSPYAMSYATISTPMIHELEAHPVPRKINKKYLKEKPLPKEPGTGKFVTKRMRKRMLGWCLQALKGAPQRKYTLWGSIIYCYINHETNGRYGWRKLSNCIYVLLISLFYLHTLLSFLRSYLFRRHIAQLQLDSPYDYFTLWVMELLEFAFILSLFFVQAETEDCI